MTPCRLLLNFKYKHKNESFKTTDNKSTFSDYVDGTHNLSYDVFKPNKETITSSTNEKFNEKYSFPAFENWLNSKLVLFFVDKGASSETIFKMNENGSYSVNILV